MAEARVEKIREEHHQLAVRHQEQRSADEERREARGP